MTSEVKTTWFAVASLFGNTLSEKEEQNTIDCGGLCHCALLMLSVYDINLPTTFSESNNGKDICGRHISPMQSHTRQFVNEGHDAETATSNMKTSPRQPQIDRNTDDV